MRLNDLAKLDADEEAGALTDLIDTKLDAAWNEIAVIARTIHLPASERDELIRYRFFLFVASIAAENEIELGDTLDTMKMAYLEVEESLEEESLETADDTDDTVKGTKPIDILLIHEPADLCNCGQSVPDSGDHHTKACPMYRSYDGFE